MHFEFKISVWERVEVAEKYEQEIIGKFRDGLITTSNDIFDIDKDAKCEIIEGTEERMFPYDDHGGNPTIEILDDDEKILWQNYPKI